MSAKKLPDQLSLTLGLDDPDDEAALRRRVARRLGVAEANLPRIELLKRSIDARRGRVRFQLLLGLASADRSDPLGGAPPRRCVEPHQVVVVGDGPAGLFCAYELARRGVGCTLLERGKMVEGRRQDIRALRREGVVDPDSNYCFGEGGAGTYSDGKLFTRSHKRGSVRDVIELLAQHGAPERILTDARPHIGSNRLPQVVTRLRERLEAAGVAFRFDARVVDLLVEKRGGRRAVAGVRLHDGSELLAQCVVLATGHSARDVYVMLDHHGVSLESKPFAVGVRIEHPQSLIDRIQYGKAAGHPRLPAALYRLAHQVDGRGVFTFCMCPGGFVVPVATEPKGLVLNGMSLAERDGPHGNSGLVVGVEPGDVKSAGFAGPQGGLQLQRQLEQAAYAAGGGGMRAPATRVTDFVSGQGSTTVPDSSYRPGLSAGDVGELLDGADLGLSERLRQALRAFDQQMRGYLTEEAVVIAVETRTSSAVRILRDPKSLVSPDLQGLYPCGEGAGYAGGIVSCAVDGVRVARQIVAALGSG